jgi:hypothetical protein
MSVLPNQDSTRRQDTVINAGSNSLAKLFG